MSMDNKKSDAEQIEQVTVRILTEPETAAPHMAQSKPATAHSSLIGTTILGTYRIESEIGAGGMSVVYKAEHLMLKQTVAVKMLHPHLARDEHALMRFRQEAQSACRLDHPGIIGVRDFGVLQESNQPYLVMDYAPGSSLADILSHETLEPKRALRFAKQICDALAHAHKNGVVHRDIKPSNVIVLDQGKPTERIKIVDFGIAKVVWNDNEPNGAIDRLTHTGESVGSPPYMSPEQCLGMPLDARSDVYSTGCLLYELLTAKPPFAGNSVFSTIHLQITQLPEPLSQVRRGLPNAEKLEEVVLRALAKNADNRYQSADEFGVAIDALLENFDRFNVLSKVAARYNIGIARMRSHKRALWTVAITAGLVVSTALVSSHLPFAQQQQQPSQKNVAAESIVLRGAESFQRPFRAGKTAFNEEDYSTAQKELAEAALHSGAIGLASASYQECLAMLAQSYEKTGDNTHAQETLLRLKQIKEAYPPLGSIDSNNNEIARLNLVQPQTTEVKRQLVDVLCNQAELYLTQHSVVLGSQSADNAYSLASGTFGESNPATVKALSLVVAASGEDNGFAKSEPLVTKLLASARALPPSEAQLLSTVYLRVGRWYGMRALSVIAASPMTAEQVREPVFVPTDARAREYLQKAEVYLKQSAAVASSGGNTNPRLGICLTQLGSSQLQQGKIAEGKKSLANALNIETKLGFDELGLAKVCYYTGQLYLLEASTTKNAAAKNKLIEQGDKYLSTAQNEFEKRSGDSENSALLGQTLSMRGLGFAMKGDNDTAEKLYKGGLNIGKRWDRTFWVARGAFLRLCNLYMDQHQPDKVVSLMQQVQANIKSVPIAPTAKPENDFNKPIGDNDS